MVNPALIDYRWPEHSAHGPPRAVAGQIKTRRKKEDGMGARSLSMLTGISGACMLQYKNIAVGTLSTHYPAL